MLSAVVTLLVALIIVGLIFWIINKLLPVLGDIPPIVPTAVHILFVVIVVLLLVDFILKVAGLGSLGLMEFGGRMRC